MVESGKPQTPVHAIADLAWTLLTRSDPNTYLVNDAMKTRVTTELELLFGSGELEYAVLSLLSLAFWLEDQGHPDAGRDVVLIATSASPGLRAENANANKQNNDWIDLLKGDFASFSDRVEPPIAPRFGSEPSKDAISVATLNSRKRRNIR